MFLLFTDVTVETSVDTSTVTVTTVEPGGLGALFRRFITALLTDWIHTWRYTEGLPLALLEHVVVAFLGGRYQPGRCSRPRAEVQSMQVQYARSTKPVMSRVSSVARLAWLWPGYHQTVRSVCDE